ncbi:MAG TPA: DUF5666 domain-containing protein [Terriglobales bacterium]|nr:DUF5666 domain-containing protein [Terriglobales bacterium]
MKRVLFVTLLTFVFAFAMVGCGGGNNIGPVQATGTSTTVQFGDATNDQIVKFELTVSSITLTGATGTSNTSNLLSAPVEFEFVQSAGTMEPVSLSKVPAGTYSAATFTVANPEVVVVNGTTPTKLTNVTLNSTTVNVNFASNITVGTTPLFINFDLDLANSITLTGNPPTSATVNPTFTVSTSTVAPNEAGENEDNGEEDDVHGKVTGVTAPNFTIQTESGASITFATNSTTKFDDGLTAVTDLKTGDIVEVDAMTQPDGTNLATKVEREGAETGEEAEGIISNVTGISPALTITIAHQVDSTGSATPPTTVDITTDLNTQFIVRGDKLNVSGTCPGATCFDAAHVAKGQRVEADADGQASPITARKLKLREQALVGTIAATPAPTNSSFTLTVSSTSAFASLSGASSVNVTVDSGANLKVPITAGATVRVRGLVFFDGISTYSMTAARVDDNK